MGIVSWRFSQSFVPLGLLIRLASDAKASMLESWQASKEQRSSVQYIYRTIHCLFVIVLQPERSPLLTVLRL
jgi:hypothetical protein